MDAALEPWRDFNVAMVGATAALAGLVIVAASVNIADIIKAKSLTARLASGIAILVLAITGSAIALIPAITLGAYGATMIGLALVGALFATQAAWRIFENRDPENQLRVVKSAVGFIAPLAYLVGGVVLLIGDPLGVVWFAIGSIAAIMAALLISWIVLVEVLR